MHKSCDEFEFGPDQTLTTELAVLEHMKYQCLHFVSAGIHLIHLHA